MSLYKDHIYPHLVSWLGNPKPLEESRQRIVPLAEGIVVEIGVGTSASLLMYSAPAKWMPQGVGTGSVLIGTGRSSTGAGSGSGSGSGSTSAGCGCTFPRSLSSNSRLPEMHKEPHSRAKHFDECVDAPKLPARRELK